MRLQPRGLVRHQRIGGGVRLVEAVAGEFFHQVEDGVGLVAGQAVLRRALAELGALLRHLLDVFLAHRAAQQIGAAERVAADDLRHLHHLLLIDHDAVGLLQDRLDARVGIFHFLAAVLARDEAGDQVHRAGAVQRHQRDDVLEAVGLGILEHALHAGGFELEHGDGLRLLQQLVRLRVVQRQLRNIQRRLRRFSRGAR